MQCEIITIGDEILIGQIVDTNSAWIANELGMIDLDVRSIVSVSDTREAIVEALDQAFRRSDIIIMTGGLGPTKDDVTKHVLSDYYKTKLVHSSIVSRRLHVLLTSEAARNNKLNETQTYVPESCEVLDNEKGTAPGMLFQQEGKMLISLPGVPMEMKWLMTNKVIPRLQLSADGNRIVHKTILTQGTYEAHLAELLADFEQQLPKIIKLAYLPGSGYIRLRLSARGDESMNLQKMVDEQALKIKNLIPSYVVGMGQENLALLVADLLLKQSATLSIAESCTGGYLAHLITSNAGSSAYFKGAVVAYDNKMKERMLQIDDALLISHGAVSEPVVEAMAKGVCALSGSTYGIATSGIAGPDGGTDEKPVGTVCVAVAGPNGVVSRTCSFQSSNRERNIFKSAQEGLNMLRKVLEEKNN